VFPFSAARHDGTPVDVRVDTGWRAPKRAPTASGDSAMNARESPLMRGLACVTCGADGLRSKQPEEV